MGVCVVLIVRRAHNLLIMNEALETYNTRMGVERMILFLWIVHSIYTVLQILYGDNLYSKYSPFSYQDPRG